MSEEKFKLSLDDAQSDVRNFIEPGIHEVEIISCDDPDEGVTGNREFKTLRVVKLDGSAEIVLRFYHSKAQPGKKAAVTISCQQLNHLLKNILSPEEYDKANKEATFEYADEHEGWMAMYNWLLGKVVGQKLRMKFIGEEKPNGTVISRLGFPPFAENINIPADKTHLKFDKSNPKDLRPAPADLLSELDNAGTSKDAKGGTNDLPF
jgi:hypothetical protein